MVDDDSLILEDNKTYFRAMGYEVVCAGTAEEAEKGRAIIKEAAAAKAANLPEQMIQNIAQGRLNKFFKESCLMEQEYVQDGKITVGQFLDQTQKGLVAVAFKRVNLNQD